MQIQCEQDVLLKSPIEYLPHVHFPILAPKVSYEHIASQALHPPEHWQQSCVHSECTLHQLSPYIGKLKSSIARDLIQSFSKPGDLVVDPFAGSGTVPLEAVLSGRRTFAADISPYAKILTVGKLSAPPSIGDALAAAENALKEAKGQPDPDLKCIPSWVQNFFHPDTLKEAIQFVSVVRQEGREFLMACFLGILHHERPGFLSYPSSHLVPYLRDQKYPSHKFPEMYEYRELRPRLIAKIKRAYKRQIHFQPNTEWVFYQSKIENLTFPGEFDCLITSPPYMNTLDYGRDNRLRLWFIDPEGLKDPDDPITREADAFYRAIACMSRKINRHIKAAGFCILIVGERIGGHKSAELSQNICQIMADHAPSLHLISVTRDNIPDIRRSRKNCKATRAEHILVFQKQ
jgi:hypothetical protein